MGLDSFKTDGPRKRSTSNTTTNEVLDIIHVLPDVDVSDVDIPEHITQHEIEYYEQKTLREEVEGDIVFHCNRCSLTASSLGALLKHDRLDYLGEDWYKEFMDKTLHRAPDEFDAEETFEKPDDDDEELDYTLDDDDEEDSGGLDSFMS